MDKTNNPVMPLWVGDYLKDTSDLSLIEHGAYMRLIMYYWNSGEPLPKSLPKIYRGTGAFSPDEQTIIQAILKRFFSVEGETYSHKRINAELVRTNEAKEKKVEKAKKGAEARWGKDATSIPQAMPEALPQASPKQCLDPCLNDANLNPTLNLMLNPPPSLNQKPPKSPKGEGSVAFNLFWDIYPKARRLDRAKCITLWDRGKLDSCSDQIMFGLQQWLVSHDWLKEGGKYVPHAMSFLSKRRWESVDAAKASVPVPPKPTINQYRDEALARLGDTFGIIKPKTDEKDMRDVTPQQD